MLPRYKLWVIWLDVWEADSTRDTRQRKSERVPGQIAFSLEISRSVLPITVTEFTTLGSWEHLLGYTQLLVCYRTIIYPSHMKSQCTQRKHKEREILVRYLCVSSQSALLSGPGDSHVLGTHVGT